MESESGDECKEELGQERVISEESVQKRLTS